MELGCSQDVLSRPGQEPNLSRPSSNGSESRVLSEASQRRPQRDVSSSVKQRLKCSPQPFLGRRRTLPRDIKWVQTTKQGSIQCSIPFHTFSIFCLQFMSSCPFHPSYQHQFHYRLIDSYQNSMPLMSVISHIFVVFVSEKSSKDLPVGLHPKARRLAPWMEWRWYPGAHSAM